ncbi:imidazole glycerol phosphate synthase subunit HisH [Caulobacter sp. S45]|uniref:imidazole glycerol phosphate synthase subunit HisH n=1 Tax=Caulobacter sp. S45 TaxID=1641861 RepID=UPI0015754AE8|nr:imidazole glycerol phosphate synthase subunit HisH [Caulobacter sp. S45]
MPTVALIDYGSGNLRSAEKALARAAGTLSRGHEVVVTDAPDVIARADRIVLPGVGAFSACMDALEQRPGLLEAMTDAVQTQGRPFLGVCVGMQLLASRGLEFGPRAGLDWIKGEVRRLEPGEDALKVPHVGWNDVSALPHPLFREASTSQMYFTHSYVFDPTDPGVVLAVSDYGGTITAAVANANVAGVQFHPEKSQGAGLALIARFLEWRP